MPTVDFESRLNNDFISDKDYYHKSDRQNEKIYLTPRKAFSSKASHQSGSQIMQQVSDKCQSVQLLRCRKKKVQQQQLRSSCYQTPNMKSSNSSRFSREVKNSYVLQSISPPNSSFVKICNHQDTRCHPGRTSKVNVENILKIKSEVPKNHNMHAVRFNDRYEVDYDSCEGIAGSSFTPEHLNMTQHNGTTTKRRQASLNDKVASPVGYRIKRLRTPSATAAAATTTAWVNTLIISWLIVQELFLVCPPCHARSTTAINAGNPDAKRLYDDLLSNYNKLVRPVVNTTDALQVMIKLKLSQLIDVNLKNQIMTTNLWVEQFWYDYKLVWDPEEYGGVKQLHVPSDHIWRPDIVLYNNADGNFEVTLATKATLWWNGLVEWKPPAIYKSSCEIDVEYFPFDEQTCVMKFGSWTYDGFQVDLRHMCERPDSDVVPLGIDLSEFYMSVEWDILEVPAVRNEKFYTCCDEPYLDITFNITMRRKTLFYTVNLIIPCMGISFLTVLTFYLPSDSGEKVTLSISILTSLYVFFLLVVEIIPPTSLVVPLLGKYLIFAMILVSISICVTVVVLNVHFRSPQTHKMAPWVKRVFIHILPRLLIMKRPQFQPDKHTSLRKVMLRTCIDTDNSTMKEYPPYTSSDAKQRHYNNGGVFGKNGHAMSSILPGGNGPNRPNTILGTTTTTNTLSTADEYRRAFSDDFPEDIPGLPRHRPAGSADFSPRMSDGGLFYSGCKVHGTSIVLPPEDANLDDDMCGEEDEDMEDENAAFNPISISSGGGHHHTMSGRGSASSHVSGQHNSVRSMHGRASGLSSHHPKHCPPSPIVNYCPTSPIGGGRVLGLDDEDDSRSNSPEPPGPPAPPYDHSNCSNHLHKSCACVNFIAEHTKVREEATKVKEDWKYVAMVLDRLFLWIFTLAVCVGTAGIILQAPSLYDDRTPIDREISDIIPMSGQTGSTLNQMGRKKSTKFTRTNTGTAC